MHLEKNKDSKNGFSLGKQMKNRRERSLNEYNG